MMTSWFIDFTQSTTVTVISRSSILNTCDLSDLCNSKFGCIVTYHELYSRRDNKQETGRIKADNEFIHNRAKKNKN